MPARKSDIIRAMYYEYDSKAYDDVAIVYIDMQPFFHMWRTGRNGHHLRNANFRREMLTFLRQDICDRASGLGFQVVSEHGSEILRLIYIPDDVTPVVKWNALVFNKYRQRLKILDGCLWSILMNRPSILSYIHKTLSVMRTLNDQAIPWQFNRFRDASLMASQNDLAKELGTFSAQQYGPSPLRDLLYTNIRNEQSANDDAREKADLKITYEIDTERALKASEALFSRINDIVPLPVPHVPEQLLKGSVNMEPDERESVNPNMQMIAILAIMIGLGLMFWSFISIIAV